MMRKVSLMFALPLMCLAACGQQDDVLLDGPSAVGGDRGLATMRLTRAESDDFEAAGVSDVTILIYRVNGKTTELYKNSTVNVGSGEFQYEFSLGETYRTLAMSNVSATGVEAAETLTLNIDPAGDKIPYTTPLTQFSSDKSVLSVGLELTRPVARLDFRPAETAEELAGVDFDEIRLTYSNVATSYVPSAGKAVLTEQTVTATAADGFTASLYTFSTASTGEPSMLTIDYYKNGAKVNTSISPLETGTTWEASRAYTVIVPIAANDYVQSPWGAARPAGVKSAAKAVTIIESAL